MRGDIQKKDEIPLIFNANIGIANDNTGNPDIQYTINYGSTKITPFPLEVRRLGTRIYLYNPGQDPLIVTVEHKDSVGDAQLPNYSLPEIKPITPAYQVLGESDPKKRFIYYANVDALTAATGFTQQQIIDRLALKADLVAFTQLATTVNSHGTRLTSIETEQVTQNQKILNNQNVGAANTQSIDKLRVDLTDTNAKVSTNEGAINLNTQNIKDNTDRLNRFSAKGD